MAEEEGQKVNERAEAAARELDDLCPHSRWYVKAYCTICRWDAFEAFEAEVRREERERCIESAKARAEFLVGMRRFDAADGANGVVAALKIDGLRLRGSPREAEMVLAAARRAMEGDEEKED